MLVTKELPVAIDFYTCFSDYMEVNGYQQNVFFCVFIFWWTIHNSLVNIILKIYFKE